MPTPKRKNENIVRMPAVETASPTVSRTGLSDEEIARRAYELFLERGSQDGHDVEDWLNAERQLRAASKISAA